jgi:zinc protease
MIFTKQRLIIRFLAFFIPFFLLFSGTAFAEPGGNPGAPRPAEEPLFEPPQRALYGGLGSPGDPLPAKASLRQGKLPNGLRYYILENSLPAERAYLTLAVNAGSVLEEDDEQGLAHFVEHMAFNGTRRFPGAELVNYLRSLGMRFGPEVNAYTSYDETVYGIEVPVEKDREGIKRIPEKALAIIDDWTWTVAFNGEDVEKERNIILEEYRSSLGAQERIWRQFAPVIFRGSRYADRLPIGIPEIIRNAQAETLRGFYQNWYRPDNMAVILVGDFNGEVLERELVSHFTAPAPGTPLRRPRYELPEPERGSVRTVIASDPEMPGSVVYLYYKRGPLAPERTLESYRNGIIDYLIGSMIDFRGEEEISLETSPFMYTGGWNTRYGENSRYYILAAQAKEGKTAEALNALLLEKERLVRYGFTASELARAKAALLSDLEQMAAEKDRGESEDYVREFTADFLENQMVLDPEWEKDAAGRMLPFISLKTVNAVLRSYFAEDDLALLIAVPEAEAAALPGEEALAGLVRASRTAAVAPPEEKGENIALVRETPAAGTILSTGQDESGAEVWELSNGIRLILMETANKNNEVSLYALARGGTVGGPGEETREQFSAELAAELQSASGLGPLSRPELMDFLAGKQASLSFWTGPYIRGFQGAAAVKDLETLFQMFHVYFTQPGISETGLKLVLDQYRTQLLQEANYPQAVFSRELTRIIFNNHPLFRPLEIEDLEKVNIPAAEAFLRAALNPADYTLVLTGNLGDREELRLLAEAWIASIPPGEQNWNTWYDPGIRRPGKTEKTILQGKEDRSMVFMGWFAPRPWTEESNAAALVLSEYLDIILTDEIREALGGVYSISPQLSHSPMPAGELSLGISFVCDPKREGELREAVRERLAALGAGGLDEETFNRARGALVKTFERSMENNGFIARNLANFTLITRTPLSHLRERPHLYTAVSAEQARTILRELLAGGPVEVVLLPETADN